MTDPKDDIRSESSIPRAYLNGMSITYLNEIKEEKAQLGTNFPLTTKLIDQAIDKVHTDGRIPTKENHCDVSKPVPMKLTQRVYAPVKQYPSFNFAGKVLGPRGNTLRRLEAFTQCKITVKGRNSMRDPTKEEELRISGQSKYAHLFKNLFVEISTVGSPFDCYSRMAVALREIRGYLIPDKNDRISRDQMKEMQRLSELESKKSIRFYPEQSTFEEIEDGAWGGVPYPDVMHVEERVEPPIMLDRDSFSPPREARRSYIPRTFQEKAEARERRDRYLQSIAFTSKPRDLT